MMIEPLVFKDYANVYDDLYHDKNYQLECGTLELIFQQFSSISVKSILDLGCGTGNHSLFLAEKGYSVHGVDKSEEMIALAKQKIEQVSAKISCNFQVGNIQTVELEQTFDAVICMFAVLGYQTTNDQLFSTLKTVRKHLKPGGLFICDFWYGAAVLKERPSERVKIIKNDNQKLIRLTKPLINIEAHTVDVNYHLLYLQDDHLVKEIQETHKMRFIFQPEIEFFLNQANLELIHFSAFDNLNQPATEKTWNVIAISKAK